MRITTRRHTSSIRPKDIPIPPQRRGSYSLMPISVHQQEICDCGRDPKENAVAERQNNTIKNEFLKDIRFHSIGEVRQAVRKAVEFYNNERPHMSLDNMTPRQAASYKGHISKKWTSYRENHLRNLEIQKGATNFAPQTLELIEELKKEPIQQ